MPDEKVEVVNVAVPELSSVTLARTVPPSVKLTVPVGVPEPAVTVAENVTGWPDIDGFRDDASDVIVATLATWWTVLALLHK